MKKGIISLVCLAIIAMAFRQDKPKKLFLLGDSISMQYSPFLEKMVKGKYTIIRKQDDGEGMQNLDIPKGSNIGNSRMALSYIRYKLADGKFHPDLITLNCGLHDIKRDTATGALAVDSAEYRRNLTEIVNIIKQKKIPMIWIRSTQVVDSIHKKNKAFIRLATDLEAFNAIADDVFRKAGISVLDLYSFTKNMGNRRFVDHVHYDDDTKELQAAYIAGYLEQWEAVFK
ncbi:SGNH/GDSL hydrolase family protein [Terrimonas sp. NA20]|uniref:SGNH/GDSL hydrolase family protein n=1 Tax=Terrimonas ginsenosidimutans TaxID=2908004 RepID=A0ABS9KMJ4_9BACT|nr:SGNH/GDSL hydrolase family protein [Terrimonas ginsenosidimutans]MCG2613526.1 SGNH/GDSL hydrolase family protein [Terrimonas ginsenosidimutans]